MIPRTVTHKDFLAAMAPLMELLGTNSESVYMTPGTFITAASGTCDEGMIVGQIVLSHVPGPLPDDGSRPPGARVVTPLQEDDTIYPQGDIYAELVHPVTIQIVLPAPSSKLLRGGSDEAIANRGVIRAAAAAIKDREKLLDATEADGFSRHEVQDYLGELERRPEGQQ